MLAIIGSSRIGQRDLLGNCLQLVVDNIDAARAELAGCGAKVSEVLHDAIAPFHHATAANLAWSILAEDFAMARTGGTACDIK